MTELDLRPRRKERLADQLYGQILQQIVAGTLAEGARLPSEQALCRSFGVSRPTVREALMRLHADGLVATRQGSGTLVLHRPPDRLTRLAEGADIAGLLRCLEVRIGLEGQSASLAARRRTAADLDRIAAALQALEARLADGPASEADFAFHLAVAEASGNALFPAVLRSLGEIIRHTMSVALNITRSGSQERARRVLEEHAAILDAISRKDAEAADLAMRYHLHRSRQRVTDRQRDA
ncbi:MAG: FadR family transcriptional regulator [Rhodospirillales bacterium]|jgi:DNA-binding FadR family transcriptional regulator|nr:FadR family transcriptional regulator [Rhodospirillales bacterium]